jgi:hypothetical protein
MKRGGLAYRSVLRPHLQLIVDLRSRFATWKEVTAALNELGVQISLSAVQGFAARYVKARRQSLLLGTQPSLPQARRPAGPATKGADSTVSDEFSPQLFRPEKPIPIEPKPPVLFDPAEDILK